MKNVLFVLLAIFGLAVPALLWLARGAPPTGAGVIEEGRINISLPQLQSAAGPAPLGRIILFVGSGDRVRRGQKLARLDSEVWRLAAERDKATVARAEGGLSVIEDRLAELRGKKSELRQGLGLMQSALSELEAKKAELQNQQAQLEKAGPGGPGQHPPGQPNAPQANPEVLKKQLVGALAQLNAKSAELRGKLETARQGQRKLSDAESRLEQAKIKAALQVDVAKQTAGRSLQRWRWTTVRAPRAGRVLALMANSGELIYPNQTLMQLGTGEFDLKLYLDPATAVRAGPGMSASVFVDSYPSQPLKAKVTRLVPEVEPAPTNLATDVIRLFDVQAVILRVNDRGGILKAGLPADAVINFK